MNIGKLKKSVETILERGMFNDDFPTPYCTQCSSSCENGCSSGGCSKGCSGVGCSSGCAYSGCSDMCTHTNTAR